MTIADVYRACVSGKAKRLRGVEWMLWQKRALDQTDKVPLPAHELPPIPDGYSDFDLKVLRGVQLRIQLRGTESTFQFGAQWGADWIGQPDKKIEVARSLKRFRRDGLIHKVATTPEKKGPKGTRLGTYIYAPGDGTRDPSLPSPATRRRRDS